MLVYREVYWTLNIMWELKEERMAELRECVVNQTTKNWEKIYLWKLNHTWFEKIYTFLFSSTRGFQQPSTATKLHLAHNLCPLPFTFDARTTFLFSDMTADFMKKSRWSLESKTIFLCRIKQVTAFMNIFNISNLTLTLDEPRPKPPK